MTKQVLCERFPRTLEVPVLATGLKSAQGECGGRIKAKWSKCYRKNLEIDFLEPSTCRGPTESYWKLSKVLFRASLDVITLRPLLHFKHLLVFQKCKHWVLQMYCKSTWHQFTSSRSIKGDCQRPPEVWGFAVAFTILQGDSARWCWTSDRL